MTEVFPKFIEKEGYWYNIRKSGESSFPVFNTKRKRNQIDRDGIGFTVATFDNFDAAKKFLDDLDKRG